MAEIISSLEKRPRSIRIDDNSSTVTYFGIARIGAASSGAIWQIRRMQLVSNETIITWADGDDLYDNVWDNRASLSYS